MDSSDVARARRSNPKRKIFDWISEPRPEHVTPFQQFILDIDWVNSPLGPISTWPLQLKQTVLLVVQDDTPAVVYWGDESTIVYNEPYTQLIGAKHPALQGQDPKVGFAEIWDHFEALLSNQRETGETVVEKNACLMLYRHGFTEETYFSWKFVPIIGSEGWIVGSHATVVEVTREVISDRRLSTVRSLSRNLAEAATIEQLWQQLITGIQDADKDIPLALLYSCEQRRALVSPLNLIHPESRTYKLEGCIGIERGHDLAPESIECGDDSEDCLGPWFRKAAEDKAPALVSFPEQTVLKWRGYGPSTQAVVCPIIPTNTDSALAFLVIALNPRRPFDEDYRSFVHLLTQQVTTPQLSAVILREEVDRRSNADLQEALDRDRLHKELSESETKFARFATRAPIGLAILKPDGEALSANPLWRELTLLSVGSSQVNWNEVLAEGESEPVLEAWARLISEKKPITIQTIINRPWKAPDLDVDGNPQYENTHILLAMHEMRNPLSALIGCADEITTSLKDYISKVKQSSANGSASTPSDLGNFSSLHLLDEAMEAAETIIYCAMHQKRIIDDILTLSRLDSNLITVSPEPSQPIQLVRSALKMFESEVRRADVRLDFVEQDTLRSLEVDWTLLDPSRVLQVLINLMTNAIKFTRTEARRHIEVSMGASLTKPSSSNEFKVEYIRKSSSAQDQTGRNEWGDGEVIYLTITVKDTGKGLSASEKKSLFNLFQQASPKTHIQYGGSGLGLFISRQLTEMQGGEIGVSSESGVGSIFQFYIKTRRTTPLSTDPAQKNEVQLLIREDALREACGVEMPTSPNGVKIQNLQIGPSPRSPSPVPLTPKSFHILVVEDNLVNQKVVSKQLRKSGHIVFVANHGEEALEFIQRTQYWKGASRGIEMLHVILMDLEMPVMDGMSCVRRIREYQAQGLIKGHVPVIAVTANARQDQIVASLDAGMLVYKEEDILLMTE
ncbi:Autoinducer 2 sensor kinase/phosphatase LuxQ [Lachnellula suecica]|uniref:histidine kinase n=1 Tax=Lachnellula suecica TaxID=602035 RepID=A0A8T9C8J7_9HELO|nr:Autoinducer 2 sensor kinase/phosphatase LuxQ [Lachnellula suecica]